MSRAEAESLIRVLAHLNAEELEREREARRPFWMIAGKRGPVAVRESHRIRRGQHAVLLTRVAAGHYRRVPDGMEIQSAEVVAPLQLPNPARPRDR